jgi:hypothetical protein
MMKEALKSGGRAIEWQGKFLAHDRDGQVDGLNASQHIGQEVAALEASSILAKGRFVIRSAVDIIENWAWQAKLRKFSEIVKIQAISQAHSLEAHTSLKRLPLLG